MKGIAGLLRLRKRSDKVKLALLLFLLGAIFAGDLLIGVAEYFSIVGEPIEYVLTPSTDGAALEGKLRDLLQRESVVCASRQREYTLTNGEKAVAVTEVSPEYLSACFGLSGANTGTDFFLGGKAFRTLCGNGAQSPARLTCRTGEENISGAFILDERLQDELAITKGTSLTLRDAQTLRVMLRGKDVSGVETDWLEENGFMIENREAVTEISHKTEMLMIRLRYGGAACILALALGQQLFKYGRREV